MQDPTPYPTVSSPPGFALDIGAGTQARYVPPPAGYPAWEPAAGDPSPVPVPVALARIARQVYAVPKTRDAKATDGGGTYRFRGIDDVMNAVHEAFADAGILVVPCDVGLTWDEVTRGAKGSIWRHYLVTIEFCFVGPLGDMLVTQSTGEGLDNSDKGLGKARSYALKDLLSRLLTLPTHDPTQDNEATPVPEREPGRDLEAEAHEAGFASRAEQIELHREARQWAIAQLNNDRRAPLRAMFDGRWPLTAAELAEWVAESYRLADEATEPTEAVSRPLQASEAASGPADRPGPPEDTDTAVQGAQLEDLDDDEFAATLSAEVKEMGKAGLVAELARRGESTAGSVGDLRLRLIEAVMGERAGR